MTSLGIRHASDPNRGIIPLRHVAAKAGLRIIRRNNFLYVPEHGSYVVMAAWLIDQPLRLVHEDSQKPCPPDCSKCRDACPTGSLEAPYAMHRRICINPATCKYPEGADVTKEDIGLRMEGWLYGCDLCQEACPFNQKKWETKREFPRLDEFEPYLDPEKILSLPDDFLKEYFQPRFWYLPKEVTPWKWKVNAICALLKERGEEARTLIEPFADHEQEELRKTALWALKKLDCKE